MFNLFKFFFVIFLFIFYTLNLPIPVYACHDPNNRSADNTPPPNSGPCPAGLTEIEQVFGNVISVVVGLGFIAMLVLLVWAGIKYTTSGGEPKAIQSAHLAVTWAFLGVLFLAIAWIILQLIQAFTGVEVTLFDIRTLCRAPGGPYC